VQQLHPHTAVEAIVKDAIGVLFHRYRRDLDEAMQLLAALLDVLSETGDLELIARAHEVLDKRRPWHERPPAGHA
jgi:hypothetical protein